MSHFTATRALLLIPALMMAACGMVENPKQAEIRPAYSVGHAAGNLEGNLALGRYHMGQNARVLALLAYSKVLEHDAENIEALSSRAVLMATLGDLEASARDLEAAIRVKPDLAYLHNNLGFTRQQQGLLPEAEAAYRHALRLDPKNDRARDNLLTLGKALPDGVEVPKSAVDSQKASSGKLANYTSGHPSTAAAAPEIVAGALIDLRVTNKASDAGGLTPATPAATVREKTVVSQPAAVTRPIRIGVVNASGVDNLGRLVSSRLRDAENQPIPARKVVSINPTDTAIYFRDGFMGPALKLSRRIPGRPGVLLNNRMDARFDVVFVMGRDVAPYSMMVGLPPPRRTAQIAAVAVSQ